ncbi:hypothetical protein PTTG_10307 [Puccinia triticina 1-1 BBBD Race 1]|uniref:Uncharacterized protein n=1 Tax=Puccinia triticina (isolate 1-1 / race 1 (BBBD)) TaxID=630390 RepID=A0A180GWA0_PUCT1|nr:hypothetical protein PTTG_10307 [Puccinia triticina 1-1 BBBD Race 1]
MDASEATKLQQKLADITKKADKEEKKHRKAKANLADALQTWNPPPLMQVPTAGAGVATTKAPKVTQPDKFDGRDVCPPGLWATPFLDEAEAYPPTLTYAKFSTRSVADYTHSPVQHASAAGWEIPTLISQYRQGLKREMQMGLIVSHTTFATINKVASLALELDTAMSGAENGTAPIKQKIDPDAMDLLALNGQLSDSKKASVSDAEYRAMFPATVQPRREKAAGTPGLGQWRIRSAN